jgi:hypothetical protein
MIQTCSYRERIDIEAEAWRAFDCQPVATGKGGKHRTAKRDKVTRTTQRFFDKLGWTQVDLGPSIYGGDDTVVMWITWEDFLKKLGIQ